MKASCVGVPAYRCHVLALWLNNLALMCYIVGVRRGIHDSLHSNGFCSPKAPTKRHDLCFYGPLSFLTILQLCHANQRMKKVAGKKIKIPQSANQTTVASRGFRDASKQRTLKFTFSALSNYIALILLISILVDSNSGGLTHSFHMALSQMTHLCSCNNHKSKKPALSTLSF